MKKKIILIALFVCTILSSYAQTNKIFLDGTGAIVDSSKAKSYLLYQKMSDTAWFVKEYKMTHVLSGTGTYKDKNLTIQHGKFSFYTQSYDERDTSSYKSVEIGCFINGQREGVWTTYYANGRKSIIDTYKNDKLNGLHENYGDVDTTVIISGYYKNDERDGEWKTFSKVGRLMYSEFYRNGKKIKQSTNFLPYVNAKPPSNFDQYVRTNLAPVINSDIFTRLYITCVVTREGKLKDPSISGEKADTDMSKTLVKILENSPLWKPPYDNKLKQSVDGKVFFMLNIKDNKIETIYSEKGNDLFHQVNN